MENTENNVEDTVDGVTNPNIEVNRMSSVEKYKEDIEVISQESLVRDFQT